MTNHRAKEERLSHRALLKDPKVRSWHDSNALRSRLSADERLRKLGLFCSRTKLPPQALLEMVEADPSHLADVLVSYAKSMQGKGNLDSGTVKVFNSLRAWISFNGLTFDRFPRLHVLQGASLRNERVPTQEELRRILGVLSPRGRVATLLMAHAGLRPGVLSNDNGTDGLTLSDLPELDLNHAPSFTTLPFLIRVPARLSKTRLDYYTFGSPELADALLSYLADRRRLGERLIPSSPVIAVSPAAAGTAFRKSSLARRPQGVSKLFITTKALTFDLRVGLRTIAPAEVRWRPYVLRAYCSTQLWVAGNHGKIDRDAREELLGHNLGVAGRYNLSKTLHPDLINELRSAYLRAEPYLSTYQTKDLQETEVSMAKVMLLGLGYTNEDLVGKDLLDPQIFHGLVQLKMPSNQPKQKQKLVEASELPHYLEDGWTVVTALNGHQVVLNPPGA